MGILRVWPWPDEVAWLQTGRLHAKGNRMGGSATQLTLDRGYAGRRPLGWHDAGGECSVVPPEWTEIRQCVYMKASLGQLRLKSLSETLALELLL